MAARDIVVNLRANVRDFQSQMRSAGSATDDLAKKLGGAEKVASTSAGRMVQSAQHQREAWTTAGTALTTFGALTTAALGGSVKAAVDWESAWAGVTKTVDGSAQEMASLEEGLRGMARELPATHSEIAAVAEAAGQLGIQTPAIEDFTRVMVDMGESTNLTADEAATTLARFANIAGTEQSKFSNLGSAIVDLGNNFATTEREISEMGLRLAGAGAQIGLSEGEILGLATALSSVGIEAQAGGTAFSRVMIEMRKAVDTGGAELQTFAETAGMTGEQFATAFRDDAGGAIAAFVTGLGEMEAQGQSTQPVLEDLGMTDIRVGDALRRAAGASDLFTEAMATGNTAFEENTALAAEAENRYATTGAQLEMLRNNIVEAAISMGEVFLPALNNVVTPLADFAGWVADLPAPLQALTGGMGALAGGASLAGGAFLLLFPRVVDTVTAFRDLKATFPGMSTGLGKLGTFAGSAGAALSFAYLADEVMNYAAKAQVAQVDTEGLADDLAQLASGAELAGPALGELLQRGEDWSPFRKEVTSTEEAIEAFTTSAREALGQNFWDQVDRFLGGAADVEAFRKEAQQLDAQLATLSADQAAEAFALLTRDMEAAGVPIDSIIAEMPQLQALLEGAGEAAAEAVAPTEWLADATGGLTQEQESATAALEEWLNMVSEADAGFSDVAGAYQELADAARSSAEEQAAATETTKDSWEDFIDGATVSMDDWIAKLQEQAEAQANWQANILESTAQIREQMPADMHAAADAMLDELIALGPEGAAAIATFTEASAEEKVRLIEAWMGTGAEIGEDFASELEAARTPEVDLSTVPAEQTLAALLTAVANSEEEVVIDGNTVPVDGALAGVRESIRNSEDPVTIGGNDAPAAAVLDAVMYAIRTSSDEVTIGGNRYPADAAVNALMSWIAGRSANVTVGAVTGSARAELNRLVSDFNGRTITAYAQVRTMGQAAVATGGYMGDFAQAAGYATGGRPQRFPNGGEVFGPGTPTSDSIPAWLSTTEFVQKAAAVKYYGVDTMYALNSMSIPREVVRGFADGGSPQRAYQYVGGWGQSQPSSAQVGPVYVQNPWTGEYMEARMVGVADERVEAGAKRDARWSR